MCYICQESNQKLLYNEEVYKAKAPKSKKTILDVIKHISRVIKVTFDVPAKARICISCYKELVRYDCCVVELLQVQKIITEKINNRAKVVKASYASTLKPVKQQAPNNVTENEDHIIKDDDGSDFDVEEPKEENTFDSDEIIDESDFVEDEFEDSGADGSISSGDFACPVCNMKFLNQKEVDSHLDTEHKSRVTCSECGVQVRSEEYLVLHMNIHNGKTETECSFCDKKYARRANVIRHMEIHFDQKKHQCERCGMFFSQSTVFFNHRLQHEAEDNPLICPVCSQSFKTKRTYKRHMITHQDDRPRYGCEVCGKVFVDKYTLKMHMQTHHQGDENETPKKKKKQNEEQEQVLFTCVICHDIFLMRDLFNEHMQNEHDVVMDT